LTFSKRNVLSVIHVLHKGYAMLTVRLDREMEDFLKALSEETHRPKSFFVKQALKNYQEDMQDWLEAQKRANAPDRNLISLQELENALGH